VKNKFLTEILKMPAEQRRRLRIDVRRHKRYRPAARREYTQEELLEWAKERNIKTTRQLDAVREKGDPTFYIFKQVFGSWNAFKEMAYGREAVDPFLHEPPNDAKYIMEVIVQFQLWRQKDYERARQVRPEVVPSISRLRYQFGRWSNAVYCAERWSAWKTLEHYVRLRDKLGRWPTGGECKKAKLDLRMLLEIHRTSKALQRFIENMERG